MSNSFKCSRLKIQGTASHLNNNMAVSTKYFAICSIKNTPTIYINSYTNDLYKNEIQIKEEANYIEAKYLKIRNTTVLAVIASKVVKIFSEDGSKLISFIKLSPNSDTNKDEFKLYSLGKVVSQDKKDLITCGSSQGHIFVIENVKDNTFKNYLSFQSESKNAITCLATYDGSNRIIAGASNGEIFTLYMNLAHDALLIGKAILLSNSPITSLTTMKYFDKGYLIATGDLSGRITFFDSEDHKKKFEVCSHARFITSLQGREGTEEIMSTGEDGYINKWVLKEKFESEEIELLISFKVPDQIVTGASYLPGTPNIIASIYEGLDALFVNFE